MATTTRGPMVQMYTYNERGGVPLETSPPVYNLAGRHPPNVHFQSLSCVFPDVYDLTLRQALRKIEIIGLTVGKLEYKSDIATNKILDFK